MIERVGFMDYQEQLKKLLEEYIGRYESTKDECYRNDTIIALYEELMPYLALNIEEMDENRFYIDILLDTIYNNDIYSSFYSRLLTAVRSGTKTDELNNLITKIGREYIELDNYNRGLKKSLVRRKFLVRTAKRALICMKYHNILTENYAANDIKKIISYFEIEGRISNEDELLLINEIELYNRRIASLNAPSSEREYTERLYQELPNALLAGFQEHDHIEVSFDRQNSLNKLADEIPTFIDFVGREEMVSVLSQYRNYCEDDREFQYVITRILDKYLDDLIVYYELLTEKDTYKVRENRLNIISDYYDILNKYLCLLDYYNKLIEVKEVDVTEEVDDEATSIEAQRRIVFAGSSSNPTKARILSDMKDVPHEYYDTVLRLIEDFMANKNARDEYKSLVGNGNKAISSCRELKSDQVRIVLKHLSDDVYCILGVFVKKVDKDMHAYIQMASRSLPDTSTPEKLSLYLKLGEDTLDELTKLVSEKGRRGTR